MRRSTVPRKFHGTCEYRDTEYYRDLCGTSTANFSTAVYRGYRKYRPTLVSTMLERAVSHTSHKEFWYTQNVWAPAS